MTVQCFAEATCSVRGDQDFATGHIEAVSAGDDSLSVSWSVDGVPRAQHLYEIAFTSPTVLDCVPLADDVVCLLQTSQGAHHTSAAVFSVNASGMTDIKSFDAYGVFLLQPLDEKQLLLWSWTSSALLDEPEPYGEAWQTWVVTATSMELTGCGPTRTDGKASGPTPEEPMTLPCPDGSGPGG